MQGLTGNARRRLVRRRIRHANSQSGGVFSHSRPHHPSSDVGRIDGGHVPLPGGVSLAHNGVRFLDERPEFRRHVLEVLRQPLEEGVIYI
jgi:predicted ATPase with chaperone activity